MATLLTEDQAGRMVNAEGAQMQEQVWGKRSPWVDYSGTVDGTEAGIAIMDNPSNPRYPTYWHARAYGLFAAIPIGLAHEQFSWLLFQLPGSTLSIGHFYFAQIGHSHCAATIS